MFVDDQEFVDPDVFGKKAVSALDGVGSNLAFVDGVNGFAGGHGACHGDPRVPGPDNLAREQAQKSALGVDHRKRAEREPLVLHQSEDFADLLVWRDLDRVGDEPVDVVFNPGDFVELLPFRHVAVDEAQAARKRHRDGHGRFGDRVHVGREDGQVQVQPVVEHGIQQGFPREDIRIQRGKSDVVVGERQAGVVRKKFRGRLVKLGVCECCHAEECQRSFG